MTYREFYAQLKAGTIQKLYLFEGMEEYGKESALKALRAALLSGPLAMMNEALLQNPSASEVIAACETLPIMEERRLVRVVDSQELSGRARASTDGQEGEEEVDSAKKPAQRAAASDLSDYVSRLPETTCLVFYEKGKANGSRRLYKKIKELGGVVSFDPLEGEQLIKWVAREFSQYGKQIAWADAERLVFICGKELMSLRGEIAKVAAVAGDRPAIQEADIEAIATKSLEYKVFDLAEQVAQGRAKQALPTLTGLLQAGEQRLLLLALLQRHYRQLLLCKLMEGQNPAPLAGMLGVPPFVVRRLVQGARNYGTKTLKQAYLRCIELEFQIKSGLAPEEGSLESLVLWLIHLKKEEEVRVKRA